MSLTRHYIFRHKIFLIERKLFFSYIKLYFYISFVISYKEAQHVVETQMSELTAHLNELEVKQEKFNSIVEDVKGYIREIKNRPRPKSDQPGAASQIQEDALRTDRPVQDEENPIKIEKADIIPVLVIACNRPTVSRALGKVDKTLNIS